MLYFATCLLTGHRSYCLFVDQCNVDLPTAVHDKMLKNARKYPAEFVKGSSKKYNEYKRQRMDTVDGATGVNGNTHSMTDTSSDNGTSSDSALI